MHSKRAQEAIDWYVSHPCPRGRYRSRRASRARRGDPHGRRRCCTAGPPCCTAGQGSGFRLQNTTMLLTWYTDRGRVYDPGVHDANDMRQGRSGVVSSVLHQTSGQQHRSWYTAGESTEGNRSHRVPPAGQSVRPLACAAWQCPAQFVPAHTKTCLIATADSLLHDANGHHNSLLIMGSC